MKWLSLLLLLPAPLLRAEPIPAASRITEVVVYSDRARVTRSSEVALPAGESIVEFAGLPANLDESSVQAAGESRKGARILSLEVRNRYSEKTLNETVRKLQEDILALDDQSQKLADEVRDLQERRQFLNQLRENMTKDLGKDIKANQASAPQLKGVFDFYGSEIRGLTDRTRAIALEQRALQPKRNKLQEELNRLMSGQQTVQKSVLVAVATEAAATAALKVSYVMAGASWKPIYDARARVDDSRVDLTYYGLVRQRTGEDWKDVKLSLSTARAGVSGRMADLQPWWLNFLAPPMPVAQPTGALDYKSARMMAARVATAPSPLARDQLVQNQGMEGLGMDASKLKERDAMEAQTAALQSHGVSAVFQVKVPATIPSDGEPHKSTISILPFKGKFEYVATPKLAENAYLKARLTNATETPILGGEVNLFLEDDFIGRSAVRYVAPSADFDFFLGVDDGIKITRNQVVDKRDTSGIFSMRKKNLLQRKYEITVENFKKTPQTVTLHDQVPVSKNAEIEVTGVKISPAPKTQEKESGMITWELSLQPREKKKLTLEFQVEWPPEKQVDGL